jgi:hypothetical protein
MRYLDEIDPGGARWKSRKTAPHRFGCGAASHVGNRCIVALTLA